MVPWRPSPEALPDIHETSVAPETSITSLASEVPAHLVRAVPLDTCLSSLGAHFRTGARRAEVKESYQLSHCVTSIDAFLSHDWKTSRWSKTCALLLEFNSSPAALASFAAAVVTSALVVMEALPGGWPTASAVVYGTFHVFLFFWQRIRRLLLRSQTMVFLDRLCIAQHEDALKRQGILGLGGILSKCTRLVVLWSPRYFSRTWCTFELACFLRKETNMSSIELIPVSMALLLWSVMLFLTLSFWAWQCWVFLGQEGRLNGLKFGFQDDLQVWDAISTFMLFILPVLLTSLPLQIYYGIKHMQELLQLRLQMRSFSVRHSQCSCCAVGHVHPETGDLMLCDKQLIFQTLLRWYPGAGVDEDHLDRFDMLVREHLGLRVLQTLGSGTPSFRHVLAMVLPTSFPALPQYVRLTTRNDAKQWQFMLDYLKLPAVALFFMWAGLLAWRVGAALAARLPICIVVPIAWCMSLVMIGCFWLPYEFVANSFFGRPHFILGALIYLWTVLALLYCLLYFRGACQLQLRLPKGSK